MHFIAQGHLNIIHHQRNCALQERLNASLKSGNMNSAPAVFSSLLMNQNQAVVLSCLLSAKIKKNKCLRYGFDLRLYEGMPSWSFIHSVIVGHIPMRLPPSFRCFRYGSQHRVSLHMALFCQLLEAKSDNTGPLWPGIVPTVAKVMCTCVQSSR